MLELINYWWGPDPIAHKFYDEQSVYSCVILSVVTTGLIGAYIILVYHIRKYFKDQMVLEMSRLTVLFAIFCVCYGLRTFY